MARTLAEALTEKERAEGNPPDHIPAAKLGVAPATYSRWKAGLMIPKESSAAQLAAYLDLPLEEIYLLLSRSRMERNHVGPVAEPGEFATKVEHDELNRRVRDDLATKDELDTLRAAFDALVLRIDEWTGEGVHPTPVPPRVPTAGDLPARSPQPPKPSKRAPRRQ